MGQASRLATFALPHHVKILSPNTVYDPSLTVKTGMAGELQAVCCFFSRADLLDPLQ